MLSSSTRHTDTQGDGSGVLKSIFEIRSQRLLIMASWVRLRLLFKLLLSLLLNGSPASVFEWDAT